MTGAGEETTDIRLSGGSFETSIPELEGMNYAYLHSPPMLNASYKKSIGFVNHTL